MKNLSRGFLITLEGIDGSGKSTIAKALADHLRQKYPVVLTKEPGGTHLGTTLRSLVQDKKIARTAKTEYLLFAADRAQHFHEIVIPALKDCMIVISDRMADSSLAYQGFGRGLDQGMIHHVNHWVMEGRSPDLVLYLRISPSTALDRVHQRNATLTAFEQKDFMERVYHGFETIFAHRKEVITIDAEKPLETVITHTLALVDEWIKTHTQ